MFVCVFHVFLINFKFSFFCFFLLICRRIRKERAHNLNYYFFYILNIFILTNLDLSESKAFRALVNSFKQISTQFVIGFVNGQVELIEARKDERIEFNVFILNNVKEYLTMCELMVIDLWNGHHDEFGIFVYHSFLQVNRILAMELLKFQSQIVRI